MQSQKSFQYVQKLTKKGVDKKVVQPHSLLERKDVEGDQKGMPQEHHLHPSLQQFHQVVLVARKEVDLERMPVRTPKLQQMEKKKVEGDQEIITKRHPRIKEIKGAQERIVVQARC